jgi:uncharacterized OsmC-like protein
MSEPTITNGVNVTALFETIDAVKETPDLAKSKFRARHKWIDGGFARTTIQDFYTAGQEDTSRSKPFYLDHDEPPVLLGFNRGVNPVEYAISALAGCLTTGMVYHAAARGIEIQEIEAHLEGDLDLQGFLGLRDDVRRGYENIRVHFRIKADAPDETLEELIQMAQKYSPVFDIVTNPTPVTVSVERKTDQEIEETVGAVSQG